jgi:hypothetical protein
MPVAPARCKAVAVRAPNEGSSTKRWVPRPNTESDLPVSTSSVAEPYLLRSTGAWIKSQKRRLTLWSEQQTSVSPGLRIDILMARSWHMQ